MDKINKLEELIRVSEQELATQKEIVKKMESLCNASEDNLTKISQELQQAMKNETEEKLEKLKILERLRQSELLSLTTNTKND